MIWRRLLAYFLAILGVTATLTIAGSWYPGSLKLNEFSQLTDAYGTSEFSPIELMQLGILVVSGLLLAGVARDSKLFRPLAVAIGGTSIILLIRELDYFLDRYIVDNLWQALIAVAGALLIAYLYRHQRLLRLGLARVWPSPGMTLLYAGLVILVPFSILVGHEALWQSILGDAYARVAKLAVEEFIELAGYFLWLAGSIEFVVEIRGFEAARRRD
jgi:hypothetical protein